MNQVQKRRKRFWILVILFIILLLARVKSRQTFGGEPSDPGIEILKKWLDKDTGEQIYGESGTNNLTMWLTWTNGTKVPGSRVELIGTGMWKYTWYSLEYGQTYNLYWDFSHSKYGEDTGHESVGPLACLDVVNNYIEPPPKGYVFGDSIPPKCEWSFKIAE